MSKEMLAVWMPELKEKLEKVAKERGYVSTSEFVRDIIRRELHGEGA